MPLAQGQVLNNRYRIAALLAQGGFGAVYRAWDLNLNSPVALKENLTGTPEAVSQFTIEAKLLANLRHENLPYVIDYFSLPGQGEDSGATTAYMVMEFVEGQDLQSMVDDAGSPLPETQAVTWVIQVCNALIYLHAQNPPIIHRDIKPANIKITSKDNAQGHVMLVDFGIAKIGPSRKTEIGARAVTQGFSPPEQYGTARTDARSDIYALGATLYAMLTVQTPVDSLKRKMGAALLTPRQLNPAISPAMEQAILRAMQIEPQDRFQSAQEFKNALSACLLQPQFVQRADASMAQTLVAAGPPPELQRALASAPPRPAARPAPVPPGPPPYAALAGGAVAKPARPQKPAAPPKPRSQAGVGVILLIGVCLLLAAIGLVGGYAFLYERPTSIATPGKTSTAPAVAKQGASITPTGPPTATKTRAPAVSSSFTPLPPILPSLTFTRIPTLTPVSSSTPTPALNPHATWYPCQGVYASRLHVGDHAYVSYDPPLPNRVRAQPNVDSPLIGSLAVGEKMEILQGPICAGGWVWWQIKSLEQNLTGWTAEGDASSYWLVPLQ